MFPSKGCARPWPPVRNYETAARSNFRHEGSNSMNGILSERLDMLSLQKATPIQGTSLRTSSQNELFLLRERESLSCLDVIGMSEF